MNRNIFILWLGDEILNSKRANAINLLPKNKILITKYNLDKFILKDNPLHPAYEYLSTIHKSDYLRCYLLHHYGGGYSDIKDIVFDWEKAFDKLENNTNLMLIGFKTEFFHTFSGIEEWSDETKYEINQNINNLICMGWFVARKYSPITTDWYNEVNSCLDKYLPLLKMYPAKFTRECYHKNLGFALERPIWEGSTNYKSKYPISWNILLAQILYPLQLKYINNIDNSLQLKHVNNIGKTL